MLSMYTFELWTLGRCEEQTKNKFVFVKPIEQMNQLKRKIIDRKRRNVLKRKRRQFLTSVDNKGRKSKSQSMKVTLYGLFK